MRAPASAPERQWIGGFTTGGPATLLTLHDPAMAKDVASTVDLPSMGAKGTRIVADRIGRARTTRHSVDGRLTWASAFLTRLAAYIA